MLKGAILGVGHVAVGGHFPGWRARPDASIVAGADARPERRALFEEAFPEARWYETAQALLAGEALDFVDICTPPSSHAALTREALARSIHVLCEKPLVRSPEELRGLPGLASEGDRTLCTVHNWLHSPALSRITAIVASGALGEIRRAQWETLRDKPAAAVGGSPAAAVGVGDNWRVDPVQSGGGILVDHGWHAVYALAAWLGQAPEHVAARLETRKHTEWPVEDTARVILAFPSASAEIFLTWAADTRANRLELVGTRGSLRLDGGRLTLQTRTESRGAEDVTRTEEEVPPLTEGSHHPDWFAGVIDEFFGEIADPARRGRNLAVATLCVQVLALARQSSGQAGVPMSLSRLLGSRRAGA